MKAGAERTVPQPKTPGRPGTRVSESKRRMLVRGRNQHGPIRQRTPGLPTDRGSVVLATRPCPRCTRDVGSPRLPAAGTRGAADAGASDGAGEARAQSAVVTLSPGHWSTRPGSSARVRARNPNSCTDRLRGIQRGAKVENHGSGGVSSGKASAVLLDALAHRVSSWITCHQRGLHTPCAGEDTTRVVHEMRPCPRRCSLRNTCDQGSRVFK